MKKTSRIFHFFIITTLTKGSQNIDWRLDPNTAQVSQNTDGNKLKNKESTSFYSFYSAQAQSSRVILLPIFQEQIGIDNAKNLLGFHKKPSKLLTVIAVSP